MSVMQVCLSDQYSLGQVNTVQWTLSQTKPFFIFTGTYTGGDNDEVTQRLIFFMYVRIHSCTYLSTVIGVPLSHLLRILKLIVLLLCMLDH